VFEWAARLGLTGVESGTSQPASSTVDPEAHPSTPPVDQQEIGDHRGQRVPFHCDFLLQYLRHTMQQEQTIPLQSSVLSPSTLVAED